MHYRDAGDHPLANYPVVRRMDQWAYPLLEVICKHGVGHPMPESVKYLTETVGDRRWGSHGCDGCCIRKAK